MSFARSSGEATARAHPWESGNPVILPGPLLLSVRPAHAARGSTSACPIAAVHTARRPACASAARQGNRERRDLGSNLILGHISNSPRISLVPISTPARWSRSAPGGLCGNSG